MEFYGHSGDLLRRKQTIINLHVELNEWRTQMEAHPGDSEAANVFLARAREQLEADAMLEKAKAAAPLPGSAPKDGNSDCASTTAMRTALPQKISKANGLPMSVTVMEPQEAGLKAAPVGCAEDVATDLNV